jgi:hypothetical protein
MTQPARRPLVVVGSELVSPEDLASVAEIAAMFGVTKRSARKYAARPDFPEPLGRVSAGPIWRRDEVDRWGREHLPLRVGRPPKQRDHPS